MEELFGESVSLPEIVIYPTERIFRIALNLPEETKITARYAPQEKKIHVVCSGKKEGMFERSLRHEAAHYYIDRVFGKVPLLLDEGIAAYMEEGGFEEGASAERINRERLREFRALLRRGRVPDLERIFVAAPVRELSSADYAFAWAFVFAMLHHPDQRIQAARRETLRSLLSLKKEEGPVYYRFFRDKVRSAEGNPGEWEVKWRRRIWYLGSGRK